MPLKAYTLGNNGFVRPEVREALGQPLGRNQAAVIIVAATKKAAVELAGTVGVRVTPSDPEFRMVDASQIVEWAGDRPGVFATTMIRRDGSPLVELHRDGWRPVGRYGADGLVFGERAAP